MGIAREVLYSSLKENTVSALVDIAISLLAYLIFGYSFISSLGLLLLIESSVLMLVGGALDFARSASGRKMIQLIGIKTKQETSSGLRAWIFTLTGVLMFLESLILAVSFY